MSGIGAKIYSSLPVFLQNVACSLYGYREAQVRLGKEFERRLRWLRETEKWSAAEIEACQSERLRELIAYTYSNVPYYRERMQALKLTPEDIRTVADLPKLPILTKEDVRAHGARLLSQAARRQHLIERHTSGTTGKSLALWISKESVAFQWAVWWRHRMRFGLQPGAWHVNFTGKVVVPPWQSKPPYWRWNRPMHQVLVPMQHLTAAKARAIVQFLDEHEFEFYSGYPSIIHALVIAAREAGVELRRKPRVIATGAENMLSYQRADIEAFTSAILTDQWGLTEACANASHCAHLRYHEDVELGIIERLPERTLNGITEGRLLCTGLANREFPFIRYECGDIGTWRTAPAACACGLQSPTLEAILGRADDYVITPEGTRIMRFDYVFKGATQVKESQVVQDRLGEIRVRIVRRSGYGSADEQQITAAIRHWISPSLKIHYEYVDEIERAAGGKFRAVKSNLGT